MDSTLGAQQAQLRNRLVACILTESALHMIHMNACAHEYSSTLLHLKIARGVHPTKTATGEKEKEKRDDADGKYPCNDYTDRTFLPSLVSRSVQRSHTNVGSNKSSKTSLFRRLPLLQKNQPRLILVQGRPRSRGNGLFCTQVLRQLLLGPDADPRSRVMPDLSLFAHR